MRRVKVKWNCDAAAEAHAADVTALRQSDNPTPNPTPNHTLSAKHANHCQSQMK